MEHHKSTRRLALNELIQVPASVRKGIYKCRVLYTADGIEDLQFIKYTTRKVDSLSLVDIQDRGYSFKYRERAWIEDLLRQSGTDEIVMCQNGRITDASYANLVFFDGVRWITPSRPLLKGVKRHQLLLDKKIAEEAIGLDDLHRFSHVKLINAMMTWEESPLLDLKRLV
jgi:4-amino-4-deoxychorismate lyase